MCDVREILRDRLKLLCDEYEHEHRTSQAEVARQLGMPTSKLNRLLSLQLKIGFKEAKTISKFFDVSISWLCGESEIREKLSPELQQAIKQLLDKT